MSSEMVERVALAIHNREYEGELAPAGTAEHALFVEIARVAIAAMLEPTNDMLKQFIGVEYGVYGDVEAKAIWKKMLNAALADPDLGAETAAELKEKGLA